MIKKQPDDSALLKEVIWRLTEGVVNNAAPDQGDLAALLATTSEQDDMLWLDVMRDEVVRRNVSKARRKVLETYLQVYMPQKRTPSPRSDRTKGAATGAADVGIVEDLTLLKSLPSMQSMCARFEKIFADLQTEAERASAIRCIPYHTTWLFARLGLDRRTHFKYKDKLSAKHAILTAAVSNRKWRGDARRALLAYGKCMQLYVSLESIETDHDLTQDELHLVSEPPLGAEGGIMSPVPCLEMTYPNRSSHPTSERSLLSEDDVLAVRPFDTGGIVHDELETQAVMSGILRPASPSRQSQTRSHGSKMTICGYEENCEPRPREMMTASEISSDTWTP